MRPPKLEMYLKIDLHGE